MAKYHGMIGLMVPTEISKGKWKEVITEREYSGEIKNANDRYVSPETQTLYDDIAINYRISIIADPFLNEHYPSIKYAVYKGIKWRVKSVDPLNYPRLILTLGEVYTNVKQI